MKHHESVEELNRLLKVRLEEMFAREKSKPSRPQPVITITREPGCGAESIDEQLCSELGLHLYDWEVVEEIVEEALCRQGLKVTVYDLPGKSQFPDKQGSLKFKREPE